MRPSAPLASPGRTPPKNRQIYGFFAKTQYGRQKSRSRTPRRRHRGRIVGTQRTQSFSWAFLEERSAHSLARHYVPGPSYVNFPKWQTEKKNSVRSVSPAPPPSVRKFISVPARPAFRTCGNSAPSVRECAAPPSPFWGAGGGIRARPAAAIPAPCPYSKIIPYLCADI